jgi:nucleobase:cation symporter-1, NCS1 family
LAKFDSWVFALLAALTFAVAMLGINLVANFVSPAFDFANIFPKQIDFKKGGYIAAPITFLLYPFASCETGAANFVNFVGSAVGPILGVLITSVVYFVIGGYKDAIK